MKKREKIKLIFTRLINYLSFIWHPKNFIFCLRYPFLKRRNLWSGEFLGYKYTLYDDIPYGWQKAFGKQLIKELKNAFSSRKEMKQFIFEQIKEKYGGLRLYCGPATRKVFNVLEKYEDLSYDYCIICGKSIKDEAYETSGWILYLCKDCFIEDCKKNEINEKELEKALKKARVKKDENEKENK